MFGQLKKIKFFRLAYFALDRHILNFNTAVFKIQVYFVSYCVYYTDNTDIYSIHKVLS